MTHIAALNLTEKQTDAVKAAGATDIEDIDGEMLAHIDGRLRNGIAISLERWKRDQEPDEPLEARLVPPSWHDLAFGYRKANLREQCSYIRKLTKHGMDYTAVLFDDLLIQVRPLFLQWGISWHTAATQIVSSRSHDRGDLLILEDLILFTFRFQCVEGQAPTSTDRSGSWYQDIQVPARAFDVYNPNSDFAQGDKGPGKAHTYGQKIALRTFLNLPAGDDPDFTPAASLGTRARAYRDELVNRMRRAIENRGIEDIDAEIKRHIDAFNSQYSRGITALEDVDDHTLVIWCEHYETKTKPEPAEDCREVDADPQPCPLAES